MKKFEFVVRETISKTIYVEAETEEEAKEIALYEDLSKNFDDYALDAFLINIMEVEG